MFNLKDYLDIGMVVKVTSYQVVIIEELLQDTFYGLDIECNGIEILKYDDIYRILLKGEWISPDMVYDIQNKEIIFPNWEIKQMDLFIQKQI